MTDDEIRFPTLGHAIAGRLTTGAVKGAVALLAAWICTKFISTDAAFDKIAVAMVLAVVVSEIASAIIERPIVLRERRSGPGGMAYVLLPFTASLMISFVAAFGLTRSLRDSILVTIVIACCNTAEVLWLKSWIPGPTPEEEQATFNEFKAMTKEQFADDVAEIKRQAREKTKEKYYKKKARIEAREEKRNREGREAQSRGERKP